MSETDVDIEQTWYWDRRTDEAYYPIERGETGVVFVTVRHHEEVADARDCGAFVPIEETNLTRPDATFDLLDSFRLPDDPESLGDG